MSSVIINDILPRTQAIATLNQTVFNALWTANYPSDVVVYQTPFGSPPNDVTQILAPSQYNVTFIGDQLTVRVTLISGTAAGDVITLIRNTPADRENLYTNTNFLPSMLNNDFGILTLVDQQNQLVNQQIAPRYNYSALINNFAPTEDTILPILPPNNTWLKNNANTAITTYYLPPGGVAPAGDRYVLLAPDTINLPNSFALNSLPIGFLVNVPGTPTLITTSILGTGNEIDVLNGLGIGGATVISLTSNPIIPGSAGMGIPIGTTAQRVIPVSNIGLRYNTDIASMEFWNGSSWITVSQADVLPGLQNQLAWYASSGSAISGLTSGNNGVLITSAGGVPSIGSTLPSAVQLNITSLGTIGTGVWQGTVVGLPFGGTGANLTPSNGGILYSTASTMAILGGTVTAGQMLQSGSSAAPAWSTATYPATAGTIGHVLTSDGTNWISSAPATSGTVTSIATNNGLTGGTITSTGTLGLAAIADHTLLANISGGSLYPTSTTLTALIDNAIGSTQGDILYRNGSIWTVLAPGTNGQVLTTGGAAANVSWSTQTGSGTVNSGTANQLAYYAGTGTVISGLATANSSVLVTNGSGVPVWATTLPNMNLGTPTALVLTNATGLVSGGVATQGGVGIPVQFAQTQLTTTVTISGSSYADVSGLSVAVSPTANTSKVLVRAIIGIGCNVASDAVYAQIVRGSTPIGIATSVSTRTAAGAASCATSVNSMATMVLEWLDSPATTSSTTYKIQILASGGGSVYVNRSVTDTDSSLFPRTVSTISVMEIK